MRSKTAIAWSNVTGPSLRVMKAERKKIVALTCYDYTMARLLNESGVDVLLVGDSLGMVKLGLATTLPVTVDDMAYHTKIVARGNSRALLVTDMPYLSYHTSPVEAVRHAGRMMKEGAQAVKIEGGREMLPVLRALAIAKIPVVGHLGLTPQSVHVMGGFKVQGRERAQQKGLLEDAKALEKAGAIAIVIEGMPARLAQKMSKALKIPTIGIGAGVGCDGQILVIDDMLGMSSGLVPRFVKEYARLRDTIRNAVGHYSDEVRSGRFPDDDHSYH